MICDLLALRPISHITKKTLPYLHSTKIEQMTKTMVIFKRGAIFLCCIRCDPIPPQTSVQRLAHTRNVTTCCYCGMSRLRSISNYTRFGGEKGTSMCISREKGDHHYIHKRHNHLQSFSRKIGPKSARK